MDKKNRNNKIKQLLSTSKGRAVLFFGAYLVFFLALMVFARVGGSNSRLDVNYNSNNFNFNNIINNNYEFSYEVIVDDVSYLYKGSKNGSSERFTFNGVDYYSKKGIYFTNKNGVWINIDNPYIYKDFFKVDNINSFIEQAIYVSKTEYESGKEVHTYILASASINKVLENSDLDVEEIPNEIILSVNEDGYVDEIKFKLNSYCKVKKICTNNLVIALSYDNFGNVAEIVSPLE